MNDHRKHSSSSMWESSETVQVFKDIANGTRTLVGIIWDFVKLIVSKTAHALQKARPSSILLAAFGVFVLYLLMKLVGPEIIQIFEDKRLHSSRAYISNGTVIVRQHVYLDALLTLLKYSAAALAGWALMRLLADAIREGHIND